MIETADKALLPTGLRDILPPDAEVEAQTVHRLLASFAAHGFERVKPPLIEFEESLLDGAGAATAKDTFRVMDPVSQRMMGVRADMTIQVARIATTRLAHVPRPLRLCYAGQVLRVKGSQLRPERQFTQAGIELIGADSLAADAEVVALTAGALDALGINAVSVDLNLPRLVPAIADAIGLSEDARAQLGAALDQKDAVAVRALGGSAANLFAELIACVGDADTVLARLAKLGLPEEARRQSDRLAEVVRLIRERAPSITLTADAVESRGFEYHTGISFSVFAAGARGELGRGGRYRAGSGREPAVGATIFVDTVVDLLPAQAAPKRLYVPRGLINDAARWRAKGWVTVAGLDEGKDAAAEARRLSCTHFLTEGGPAAVDQQQG